MEDDDDETKWRQRMPSTLKKKGKHMPHVHLDARQYTMFIGGCFLISWGLAVTVLLLRLGIMYTFDTIPLTREDYTVKGTAAWAKTVASKDLMQAIDVWNLINASIVGLVYRQPQDYNHLGNVLSPAFETMPSLHSVDFSYSDRTSEVSVTRKKGLLIRPSSTYMQSNSADCFLMGVEGCTTQEKWSWGTPIRPAWHQFAQSLKLSPWGGVHYWIPKPELVVESAPDGGDLLSPSIRLVFKVVFPEHMSLYTTPDGSTTTKQNTVVTGRITVKVASLAGERLVDKRLGTKGAIYLCDGTGAMLASRKVEDLLTVDDGKVRYKLLWEVAPDWALKVKGAFTGSSVKKLTSKQDSTLVYVEPLPKPLGRFGIVVVAKQWGPFQNGPLIGTSAIASIVAPAPYAITGAMAFFFFWAQCLNTMRANDGKVGVDFEQKSRVSISATMQRVSMSGPAPDGVMPVKSEKLLTRMATFLKRKTTRSSLS